MTKKLMVLEIDVETPVCAYAKRKGIMHEKFTSPAKRSVPDRLFTHAAGDSMFFIEFKATGKGPTVKQARDHEKRRARGVRVYVCDNVAYGRAIIEYELAIHAG